MDIKQALKNIRLSKNFNALEFANSLDGFAIEVPDIRLFECLQYVRDKVGSISITSGFRTLAFNSKVGGSDNSYHTKGLAVDFTFAAMTKYSQLQLLDLLSQAGFRNVGLYYQKGVLQWIHADIGAKWTNWKTHNTIQYKIYEV